MIPALKLLGVFLRFTTTALIEGQIKLQIEVILPLFPYLLI